MIYPVYRAPKFKSTADALAAIAAADSFGSLQMLWSRSTMRSKRVAAAYKARMEILSAENAAANEARMQEEQW